jgi:hypothetical protein
MAIIKHGSFEEFSATVTTQAQRAQSALAGLKTFSVLLEATRSVQPVPVQFAVSNSPRGLALKSVKLTQGFDGFLQKLFNRKNEVYFVSWVWDFSGNPPLQYPGLGATPQSCIIPLKVGQVREFLGAGIVLFPARTVTAGLAVRMMLWESDQGTRNFGKAMTEVANTIQTSGLTNLLFLVTTATGVTGAVITAAAAAAGELAKAIGAILQANSDDYVDFYEGYYPAADPWTTGDEVHQGYASEIALTRLT